jgi:MarR family transcriptional repressor of emrRAB
MSFETRIDRFCEIHPDAPRDDILATRLLFRTTQLLRSYIDQALAPFELNMSQYLIMSMLSTDETGPSSPSELGGTMDATRTQMTRFLDSLEVRGLLNRRASKQDRRSLELKLTASGHRLLQEAIPAVHAAYARAWAVLDKPEQSRTTQYLQQLHAGLQQQKS